MNSIKTSDRTIKKGGKGQQPKLIKVIQ